MQQLYWNNSPAWVFSPNFFFLNFKNFKFLIIYLKKNHIKIQLSLFS